MIRLALVRHAKSDWGDPMVDDHDRPLNDRGRRDAPVMAARLAEAGFRPGVILSSTALRAQTTARAFADVWALRVHLQDRLYGASPRVLVAAAAEAGADPGIDSVLVVAHDPGLSLLAGQLSGGEIAHMPTCAVATFTWDAEDWDVATALEPADWTFDSPR